MSKAEDSKALRRIRREQVLQDYREGRRQRAERFRSAKDYRRRPKHGRWEDS